MAQTHNEYWDNRLDNAREWARHYRELAEGYRRQAQRETGAAKQRMIDAMETCNECQRKWTEREVECKQKLGYYRA
jgi:hypothetical protein